MSTRRVFQCCRLDCTPPLARACAQPSRDAATRSASALVPLRSAPPLTPHDRRPPPPLHSPQVGSRQPLDHHEREARATAAGSMRSRAEAAHLVRPRSRMSTRPRCALGRCARRHIVHRRHAGRGRGRRCGDVAAAYSDGTMKLRLAYAVAERAAPPRARTQPPSHALAATAPRVRPFAPSTCAHLRHLAPALDRPLAYSRRPPRACAPLHRRRTRCATSRPRSTAPLGPSRRQPRAATLARTLAPTLLPTLLPTLALSLAPTLAPTLAPALTPARLRAPLSRLTLFPPAPRSRDARDSLSSRHVLGACRARASLSSLQGRWFRCRVCREREGEGGKSRGRRSRGRRSRGRRSRVRGAFSLSLSRPLSLLLPRPRP